MFDKEGFKLARPERLQHLTMMVMNTDETRINRVTRDESRVNRAEQWYKQRQEQRGRESIETVEVGCFGDGE